MKKGGVLRIACPDAEFLYEVSSFDNGYWSWRKRLIEKGVSALKEKGDAFPKHPPNQMDFLIRELSTPRSAYEANRIESMLIDGDDIRSLPYHEVIEKLSNGLSFRVNHPGQHINTWDFSQLKKLGETAGFSYIIKSKPGGSVSCIMQGKDMDKTHPEMSLYVDMVK